MISAKGISQSNIAKLLWETLTSNPSCGDVIYRGIISNEIIDELQKSNISSLRALSGTASDNPNQLQAFSTILLRSEDTVQIGQEILKEYGKFFAFKMKSKMFTCLSGQMKTFLKYLHS